MIEERDEKRLLRLQGEPAWVSLLIVDELENMFLSTAFRIGMRGKSTGW